MPSLEGSNLRLLWRFRHAINKQESHAGTAHKKDVNL
jgi:hypothetical protein